MNYEEARKQIEDGDFIGVCDAHGIIGRLTQWFTKDRHTHTGVVKWIGDAIYMADLNSGRNHLTPLSQLKNFDVCHPPHGMDRDSIGFAISDWLGKPINYGFLAFVVIGLKCALGIKAFIHWRKIIVCSGGTVQIYEMAAALMQRRGLVAPKGWLEHSRMISPGELYAELPFKLSVRG